VTSKSLSACVHPDLLAAQNIAYAPSGLIIDKLKREAESEDYGAFEFAMNLWQIKFRVAKITPTKTGQFVTLWKRIGNGPILPYDMVDPVDFFVISVRTPEHFGQFVFPKTLLCEKGIVSKAGEGGKRAIRVYPPWGTPANSQAKRTQAWQLLYFFEMHPNTPLDALRIQQLFRG